MIPRLALVSVLFLFQLPSIKKNHKDYKYKIAFILLFLFAALRGTGDGDYFAYLRFSKRFIDIKDIFGPFPMEIGFRFISYINNSLGFHEQGVIIAMNFISLVCIYNFIKNYSKDRLLSIILFLPLYFQYDMHAARTAVAIGISTIGLKYLLENKLIKYIIIIVVASFFHKSALVLLPMYLLRQYKFNKYFKIGTVFFFGMASLGIPLNLVVLKFLQVLKLESIAHRFSSYMMSEQFGYSFKIYDPRVLMILATFFISNIILSDENKLEKLLKNFIWVNLILMFIFRDSTALVTRLTSYFNVYTIIIIPEILFKYKINHKIKKYCLYKLLTIYIYIPYILKFVLSSIDYKFFFR